MHPLNEFTTILPFHMLSFWARLRFAVWVLVGKDVPLTITVPVEVTELPYG